MRRSFDWPAGKVENPWLLVHHDEDGYLTDYEELPLTPKGRAALKPGKNVLAAHCHQTEGGQYIDVGIISLIAKPGGGEKPR